MRLCPKKLAAQNKRMIATLLAIKEKLKTMKEDKDIKTMIEIIDQTLGAK